MFSHDYFFDILLLQHYHAGQGIVICDVLTNGTMIWGHNLRHFRLCNHLKLSKHVLFFKRAVGKFKSNIFCEVIDSFQLNNYF